MWKMSKSFHEQIFLSKSFEDSRNEWKIRMRFLWIFNAFKATFKEAFRRATLEVHQTGQTLLSRNAKLRYFDTHSDWKKIFRMKKKNKFIHKFAIFSWIFRRCRIVDNALGIYWNHRDSAIPKCSTGQNLISEYFVSGVVWIKNSWNLKIILFI